MAFDEKAYYHSYYLKNKDKIKLRSKIWKSKNPKAVALSEKKHRAKNKKRYSEAYLNKRRINPEFRIICNLRNRIWHATSGVCFSRSTRILLGCDMEHFKDYISSQFRDGMTWENYGKYWHMDHRRPISSFNLLDDNDVTACFHYTNLQPLLAIENLKKNNKILND